MSDEEQDVISEGCVIYGQDCPHDEVRIIGNVASLTVIRDALTRAIDSREGALTGPLFPPDGEGFQVEVRVGFPPESDANWYSDPIYSPRGRKWIAENRGCAPDATDRLAAFEALAERAHATMTRDDDRRSREDADIVEALAALRRAKP